MTAASGSSIDSVFSGGAVAALGRVHFIGIGGAGMSAIARILLARGVDVSGSDAVQSAQLIELGALGARIHVGHDSAVAAAADTVVVSSAIRETDPELVAARGAGLRVLHRSSALAAAMTGNTVVAVAGTHGKTTTTAMIAVLLRAVGRDPSFAIGGTVPALGVNAAHGSSGVFVAEADESDGSFLNYRPQIAVVTNAEPDHLDHYGNAEAVYRAFDEFAALLPADGLLVACADDAGALELARKARARGTRVVLYGHGDAADLRLADDMTSSGVGTVTTLTMPAWTGSEGLRTEGPREVSLALQVPGLHNARNAVAALAVALELGVAPEAAVAALGTFSGASRRFEAKGEAAGVRVFDDYAHHPTEVSAALAAARAVAGEHRVHVMFQPHLFSRTREFAAGFRHALSQADTVAVLDIYPAREDPISGVSSELITAGLDRPGGHIVDPSAAVQLLAEAAAPGDIILTVGAGDVTQYGPVIVRALVEKGALRDGRQDEPGGRHGA
ncbi:UDP-N-acetylmuramate--L-alanine ligase [Arthrobacter sp. H14-L1]|uniref:UDP-N-acetylmuramate--L-alanine ligase n=1 Tax=Arthrobacter sp. H14-L1 TaxID=2996697 RepID=UPI00226FEB12|nr:UDP-N-acetylmuramate--L-alanine ligase [Arthrobacter sp. H14-L1]MCY0904243.1 UDP-N-acetylmuramate--L-alanine ligase [Arthrobacter sp. H14-L1]